MVRRLCLFGSACLALILTPTAALAGMPTPVLTDWATMRLSTISFFLAGILVSALVVRILWNALTKDFAKLPRLTYWRSLALVVLWGFLFVFVLTMIAGARELMTPKAWELRGITYKIASQEKERTEHDASQSLDARRQRLQGLKLALWDYALKHDGRFPESLDAPQLDDLKDDLLGAAELPYGYVSAQTVNGPPGLLAFEPDVFGDSRLVLRTDGSMAVLSGSEIRRVLAQGADEETTDSDQEPTQEQVRDNSAE